jgi:hypothetical protein
MTRDELIRVLEALPGDPPVFMWNGMDLPAPITVCDSALISGGHITVVVNNTVDFVENLSGYEGATVVLDSRPIEGD